MPKERYRAKWVKFGEVLKTGYRPDTLEDVFKVVQRKLCGQFLAEAQSLWDIIREDGNIESIGEVGRNLGGGLFMLCCAAKNLKRVCSVDISSVPEVDEGLKAWFEINGIEAEIITCNSSEYKPTGMYDFVYIDGEHTGPGVRADIENWREHARLIGFHDYADKGYNKHKREFPDVVKEITDASIRYGWQQIGKRGKSEVVFNVPV